MIHLVTGGSGSGKSEYAENWLMQESGAQDYLQPLLYVATMMPYTEETKEKIARHHRLRAGKGFQTIERYKNMQEVKIPKNRGILLECVSNLTANELYLEDGSINAAEDVVSQVINGVQNLANATERLVIVTNEVNSDINGYSEETEIYRTCIGRINQELGKMADLVTEVVYGIPVHLKG